MLTVILCGKREEIRGLRKVRTTRDRDLRPPAGSLAAAVLKRFFPPPAADLHETSRHYAELVRGDLQRLREALALSSRNPDAEEAMGEGLLSIRLWIYWFFLPRTAKERRHAARAFAALPGSPTLPRLRNLKPWANQTWQKLWQEARPRPAPGPQGLIFQATPLGAVWLSLWYGITWHTFRVCPQCYRFFAAEPQNARQVFCGMCRDSIRLTGLDLGVHDLVRPCWRRIQWRLRKQLSPRPYKKLRLVLLGELRELVRRTPTGELAAALDAFERSRAPKRRAGRPRRFPSRPVMGEPR